MEWTAQCSTNNKATLQNLDNCVRNYKATMALYCVRELILHQTCWRSLSSFPNQQLLSHTVDLAARQRQQTDPIDTQWTVTVQQSKGSALVRMSLLRYSANPFSFYQSLFQAQWLSADMKSCLVVAYLNTASYKTWTKPLSYYIFQVLWNTLNAFFLFIIL